MRFILHIVLLFSLTLTSCTATENSRPEIVQIESAFPALTFKRPLDLQSPPDDSNRLYVVEQEGRIYSFINDSQVNSPLLFLDITDRVNDWGNEEGLLGLAFDPEFQNNSHFFVNYTSGDPRRTIVSRFIANKNRTSADPNSEQIIIEIVQPYSNHNGGQIAFGPDGYLYIAVGDGGSAGDPRGNGQDLTTLLGTILRIDVSTLPYLIPEDNPFAGNTKGYREEIFAYGLRNPWRFSFDLPTGNLWTGDVGQNAIEEIDIIESGGNYGWNIMEGSHCYQPAQNCDQSGLIQPVHEYSHSEGLSITGGFVYRGEEIPELFGAYIYADYISGKIWALFPNGTSYQNRLLLQTQLNISSFGIDDGNEIYLCAFDGKIYRFKPLEPQ
jgi:glucose/arabinose dehydrogenase